MERRLTAIVAADVAEYSLFLGRDESRTLAALAQLRRDIIDPAIAQYRGRVFRLMGDGSLFEFASALNAVQFAVAVQEAIAQKPQEVFPGHALILRMGLDLGDIVVEHDDIHGTGVNVAVRLETLASSGGILISEAIQRQIKGPLIEQFTPIGERHLKNIPEPISVWRWRPLADQDNAPDAPSVLKIPSSSGRQILDPKITNLILDLHMRSARLALSDAFDRILSTENEGRNLGIDGIYQYLGDELNQARGMLSVVHVESVLELKSFGHWQSPSIMSEFISSVFDNAATAYAPRLLPQIQEVIRSEQSVIVKRRLFFELVQNFMRADMLPQIKRLIKFAFVET